MAALDELQREIGRQDRVHPAGFPATRDGLRLGLAALDDELREALDAWRAGRCKCPEPICGHHDWRAFRAEVIQVAAVAIRIVSDLDTANAGVGRPGE